MKSHLAVAFVVFLYYHVTFGKKCEIPSDDKYVNCIISSSYNVKTFQGEFFSFNSSCPYRVVDFKNDEELIRIDIGKNVINILAEGNKYDLKLSTTKEIKVITGNTKYSLPAKVGDMKIIKQGRFAVAKFPTIGLNVKWDGMEFVIIEIDNTKQYSLSGLCSKDCTENSVAFVEQWNTLNTCIAKEKEPCETTHENANAQQHCQTLLSNGKFNECIKQSNVSSFLDECQLAFCNCKTDFYNDCVCDLVDAFVKHCEARTGQAISWRREGFCEKKCQNPQQRYKECGQRQRECGESAVFLPNNETTCVEGCMCPTNLRFFANRCVSEQECPCRYENTDYPPGIEVIQDCNTCICINDNKWNCTQTICYGEADIFGDPHYTTFDGKKYDFMGKCSYYLVKGVDFTIIADHYVLENGKFIKNFNSNAPSWTKVVQVLFGDDVITLKPNLVVVVNDKEIKQFPHKQSNITISKPTNSKVIVELPNYVEIHWDGSSTAKVRVPVTMRGYIQGLMGNFNKNPKDDFMLPNGTIINDPNKFGHSWKVDGSCENENTDATPDPCQDIPSHRPVAEKACSVLKGKLFTDCADYNAQESYESCIYDCCHAHKLKDKCACETIAAHAARCLNTTTQWRKEVSACEEECPIGQIYNYCLNPCESNCDYIGINPKCQKQCLAGCGCPEGKTFNRNKECIQIEKCNCLLNEKHFPTGYKYLSGDNIKTCVKGKWEEMPANDSDKNKYSSLDDMQLNCANKSNTEYSACKIPVPITCKNMDSWKEETSDECKEGCECIDGFVLDTTNDNCVEQKECPCFYNGKSYDESSQRKIINEKCTCKSSMWECTKDENANEKCTIFGNTNIRNFDGKIISFESSCEYTIAKGEFSSKPYTVTTKSGVITIIYTDDNNEEKKITLNQATFALPEIENLIDSGVTKMLELPTIGIKLIWNKEGILYLEFKPEVADKMEGLCDNLENPDIVADKKKLTFLVESYNNDPACFDLTIPKNKDIYTTDGRPVSTKCDILKNTTFEPCTKQLPVEEYYNSCVITAQNYIQKGDTKSLEKFYCQVFSAFSQECGDAGIPIEWRSPELCPIECGDEKVYSPCTSMCSCDDIEESGNCPDELCTEGCVIKKCPKENIYTNRSFTECTTKKGCSQIKCLNELANNDEDCECEGGQVVCTTSTTTVSTTTISTTAKPPATTSTTESGATENIPVIDPEGRTDSQQELVDAFHDVKASLEHVNDPLVYNTLSPKDKQMIETFTNHVDEFEDDVNCYANIVDRSMCKCFNGEQICGINKNKNKLLENDHDIENNLELIKFMQSHLKCLENLKENLQNCTCISGRRICPERPVAVSTTAKTAPIIYHYIIKCERGVVISFYNLRFAKEGLNCLSQLDKDPTKNCRCEKGQLICSLQPKDNSNLKEPKEISKNVYSDYIDDVKKQLQCQAKIANRQESCRCEKGKEVCSKIPEPIPEENTYDVVKKYMDSPVNQNQLYDNFKKGLECTEEMGEETKVCTCMNGEKECFDMDFEDPVEVPPADDTNPAKDALMKVEDAKSQIVCLMKRDLTPSCSKYQLSHVNPTSEDILQLNVYLHYLRHINDMATCLRDKPSYCTCVLGQQCSFEQPNIPNQNQKENDQINLYNTFLEHIISQMTCLKKKKINCFCDNGHEKCETKTKNYVMYPLLDTNVLSEYDKEKLFPYINKQLHCYDTMKTISNKCSCKDGVVECEKPEILPEPEPDDDFTRIKKDIPNQLKTIKKIDNKIRCFISRGRRRNCHKILSQENARPQVPDISTPDKQLLNVYGNYVRHIKLQLSCFRDMTNSNCICSNGKYICGYNLASVNTYRNKAANTMYNYRYFVSYVDTQLNCLESLSRNNNAQFCTCGNNQICESEAKPHKLIQLLDTKPPMHRYTDMYPYIDSQVKCLYELDNKSGTCYCSNGLKICKDQQPRIICPPVNCPPNTKMVKECQECCPTCKPEYCSVDMISGHRIYKQVKKELGERWLEDCKQCQCIKDHLGTRSYCEQQECPTIPPSERGRYEYIQDPENCCPKIIQIGCEHNGNRYPVNSVTSISPCETISCVKQNGEAVKNIYRVTCNTTCPTGFVYKPIYTRCCGECLALGCLHNGEVKQYNEVWFSEDKCFKFKCLKRNDIWIVTTRRKMCRPVGPCNGIIKNRDCCNYCEKNHFFLQNT